MSFEVDIQLTGDAAAKAKIAGVGIELDKVEQKAGKARDSMGRFVGDGTAGVTKLTSVHERLTAQSSLLARSFGSLADAIERERRILERLHGPAMQHAADMQVLNSLYARGVISVREYSTEVERMRRAQAGNSSGAGVGAIGIGAGVLAGREIIQLGDAHTNLSNRIRQVSSSSEELNELMGRTKQIANDTRSDWGATGESFVRLTNATKEMGLGQERVLRLTETVNKAFSMSGASSAEASAGMLQLTQAFASGRLQGDEFRSLAEAVPSILDMIAKEMGVTRGELKKLSSEGAITSDVLVRSFENARKSIDDGFAKSVPTASQQWTVFKNNVIEGASQLASIAMPMISSALENVTTHIKLASDAWSTFRKLLPDNAGGGGAGAGDLHKDLTRGVISAPIKYLDAIRNTDFGASNENWQERLPFGGSGDKAAQSAANLSAYNRALADLAATAERLSKLDAPASQSWLGITQGQDITTENAILTAKQSLEGFNEVSAVTMAHWQAGMPRALERFQDVALNAFGVVGDAGKRMFGSLFDPLQRLPDAAEHFADVMLKTLRSIGKVMPVDGKAHSWGTTALSREEKLYREIRGPQTEYIKNVATLDSLFNSGRISASEWRRELEKLTATFAGKDLNDLLNSVRAPTMRSDRQRGQDHDDAVREGLFRLERDAEEALNRAPDLEADLKAHVERNGTIDRLMRGEMTTVNSLETAYKEFGRESGSAMEGARDALAEFSADSMNAATMIKDVFTTALREIEDAIISLKNTGEFSLSSLARSLSDMLMRHAFRGIVGGLSGGAGGGGAGPAGGAPTGIQREAPDIHVHFGEDMQYAAMSSPRGQSVIANVNQRHAHVQQAVRDMLRSRG